MVRTIDSYISQMENSAKTYERMGSKLWAQAKNGCSDEAYKYSYARMYYERGKNCRNNAKKEKKSLNKK